MALKLYYELALCYDEMYSKIFDYDKEGGVYSKEIDSLFEDSSQFSLAECGCGTGRLAKRLLKKYKNYVGIDLSQSMVDLCYSNNSDIDNVKEIFKAGDIRKLVSVLGEETKDCIIMPGRTLTYMTTNKDVNDALSSIWKVLKPNGYLIFDSFSCKGVFREFLSSMSQKFECGPRRYTRISTMKPNWGTGFTWDWRAIYTIEEDGKEKKEIVDDAVLRGFLKEELEFFLEVNNFKVLKIDESEQFFLVVQKINEKKCKLLDQF